MNWIRIAVGIGDDPRIHAIADMLGVRIPEAVGLVVMLLAKFPEHAPDGSLAEVPDASVERWGGWAGDRGAFAKAVRFTFLDEAGVWLAWEKHNGAALREAIAARQRMRDHRTKKATAFAERSANGTENVRRTVRQDDPNGSPDGSPDGTPNVTRDVRGNVRTYETDVTNELQLAAARERVTAVFDPAERGQWRVRLTAAANKAFEEQFGSLGRPLLAGTAAALVEVLEEDQVPIAWAEQLVADLAAGMETAPRTMAYFAPIVRERWFEEQARKAARNTPVVGRAGPTLSKWDRQKLAEIDASRADARARMQKIADEDARQARGSVA